MTLVPSDFFDDLVASLDAPPAANNVLAAAAARMPDVVERRGASSADGLD